jgi:hypothetical protein
MKGYIIILELPERVVTEADVKNIIRYNSLDNDG